VFIPKGQKAQNNSQLA